MRYLTVAMAAFVLSSFAAHAETLPLPTGTWKISDAWDPGPRAIRFLHVSVAKDASGLTQYEDFDFEAPPDPLLCQGQSDCVGFLMKISVDCSTLSSAIVWTGYVTHEGVAIGAPESPITYSDDVTDSPGHKDLLAVCGRRREKTVTDPLAYGASLQK